MLNIEKKGNITMKKSYIAPRVEVFVIGATQTMLTGSQSIPTGGKYNGTSKIESKDRGDYEPAEDGNFGDLW